MLQRKINTNVMERKEEREREVQGEGGGGWEQVKS